MSEDYVNQLTLNFLMSKTQLEKLNKKISQDTSNNLKSDKAMFRKDITTLFNKLFDNDIPSDLLGDVKDCFDHFIDKSIYYIKLRNDNIKRNEKEPYNEKISQTICDYDDNHDYNNNDDEYDDEDIIDDNYEISDNKIYEENVSNEIIGIIQDDSDDEAMNCDELDDDEVMNCDELDDDEVMNRAEIVDDKVKIINEVEDVVIKKYKYKRSLESNTRENNINHCQYVQQDEQEVYDDNTVNVYKKSKQKGLSMSNGVEDIHKLPVDWFHNVRQNYKLTQILPRKKELFIPR
jgi:hypothetical protein